MCGIDVRSSAALDATGSETPAGLLDRVERDPAAGVSMCSRIARCAPRELAGREGVDDAPMLGDEVRVPSSVPPRITCIIRFTDSSR